MENGHRNSGFSHEKWWIFPWQNVSSPEGIPQDKMMYNHSEKDRETMVESLC